MSINNRRYIRGYMSREFNTDFEVVVNNIKKSGLPYSSRKLIYCKMIVESMRYGYCEIDKLLGIDIAFDDVYNRLTEDELSKEDEITGC
jgi:hypothetical protein